jgi:protein-S-isoprenylcysteine O-methyltransferase Ste14
MRPEIFKPLAYSLALTVIACVWILKYGAARKARKYSEGRQAIGRDERFRIVGRVIFIISNLVTFASFWTDSKALLLFCHDDSFRIAGLFILMTATLLHVQAMKCLGDNYSPCFDSHLPLRIVTQGPYRYVRHPIYLANILLCAGYTLASCSLLVLALTAYGAFKIVKALMKEEAYLAKTFPEYEDYQAKTARLIPFIY